jgi:hypothetical protein
MFAGIAIDLAVSIPSATTFRSSSAARPPQIEVDCNHLTYFALADGMAAVRRAMSWHDSRSPPSARLALPLRQERVCPRYLP